MSGYRPRFWHIRYLKGIGFRYTYPDGLEQRCWACNGPLVLFAGHCRSCGRCA